MTGFNDIYQCKVGFIGAGKLGKALAYWLAKEGVRVTIVCDTDLPGAKALAYEIPCGFTNNIEAVLRKSDLIFITTPDDVIPEVIDNISYAEDYGTKMLISTSGLLSAKILQAAGKHFQTLAVHPFKAVSENYQATNPFKKIIWTYDGDNEPLEILKFFLVNVWRCKLFKLDGANKINYHLAACFASNLLVPNLSSALSALTDAGLTHPQRKSLIQTATKGIIKNLLEDETGCKSLTGPLVRNDLLTVLMHINTISGNKMTLYRSLSDELLKIAEGCGYTINHDIKTLFNKELKDDDE